MLGLGLRYRPVDEYGLLNDTPGRYTLVSTVVRLQEPNQEA